MKWVSFMKRLLSAILIASSICFVGCGEENDVEDLIKSELAKNIIENSENSENS